VTQFCQTHRRARYADVLIDAVGIAWNALGSYDAKQGPFGPYLAKHLNGLGRAWWHGMGFLPRRPPKQEWVAGQPQTPVTPALTVKKSWLEGGRRHFMTAAKALLGVETKAHISRLFEELRPAGKPGAFLWAEMQVTISHLARRDREDAHERRRQEEGNFDPVFEEAVPERARVWFDSHKPRRNSTVTDFEWAKRKHQLKPTLEAPRPTLDDQVIKILDGVSSGRKLKDIAAEAGIPYRTAKRIKDRIKKKLKP
jgi:hypothetical protein